MKFLLLLIQSYSMLEGAIPLGSVHCHHFWQMDGLLEFSGPLWRVSTRTRFRLRNPTTTPATRSLSSSPYTFRFRPGTRTWSPSATRRSLARPERDRTKRPLIGRGGGTSAGGADRWLRSTQRSQGAEWSMERSSFRMAVEPIKSLKVYEIKTQQWCTFRKKQDV